MATLHFTASSTQNGTGHFIRPVLFRFKFRRLHKLKIRFQAIAISYPLLFFESFRKTYLLSPQVDIRVGFQ